MLLSSSGAFAASGTTTGVRGPRLQGGIGSDNRSLPVGYGVWNASPTGVFTASSYEVPQLPPDDVVEVFCRCPPKHWRNRMQPTPRSDVGRVSASQTLWQPGHHDDGESRPLLLFAPTFTTDRQDCDVRRCDALAETMRFVAASGPLLRCGRNGTLNTSVERALCAPYFKVGRETKMDPCKSFPLGSDLFLLLLL